jgi:hypothetical protein
MDPPLFSDGLEALYSLSVSSPAILYLVKKILLGEYVLFRSLGMESVLKTGAAAFGTTALFKTYTPQRFDKESKNESGTLRIVSILMAAIAAFLVQGCPKRNRR